MQKRQRPDTSRGEVDAIGTDIEQNPRSGTPASIEVPDSGRIYQGNRVSHTNNQEPGIRENGSRRRITEGSNGNGVKGDFNIEKNHLIYIIEQYGMTLYQ